MRGDSPSLNRFEEGRILQLYFKYLLNLSGGDLLKKKSNFSPFCSFFFRFFGTDFRKWGHKYQKYTVNVVFWHFSDLQHQKKFMSGSSTHRCPMSFIFSWIGSLSRLLESKNGQKWSKCPSSDETGTRAIFRGHFDQLSAGRFLTFFSRKSHFRVRGHSRPYFRSWIRWKHRRPWKTSGRGRKIDFSNLHFPIFDDFRRFRQIAVKTWPKVPGSKMRKCRKYEVWSKVTLNTPKLS